MCFVHNNNSVVFKCIFLDNHKDVVIKLMASLLKLFFKYTEKHCITYRKCLFIYLVSYELA